MVNPVVAKVFLGGCQHVTKWLLGCGILLVQVHILVRILTTDLNTGALVKTFKRQLEDLETKMGGNLTATYDPRNDVESTAILFIQ